VGDHDPALEHQLFDLAQAQREAVIQPHTMADDLRRESKFAGLVSYGASATLLAELLPLGRPLHPTAIRHHAWAVAQRLENKLGDEQFSFIEGCPRD
jgi:hypothetical protein